jgi:hypothetical protein
VCVFLSRILTAFAGHRYFIWQYEQALRNECGYKGYQPYWNWALTAQSGLDNSSLFDGSDSSLSSNGQFIPGRGDVLLGGNGLPEIPIPAGTGGGCIKSGPFKDMKVNLGPVALGLTNGSTVSNGDGLGYNPRCLQRDLTDYSNKRWANATSIVDLILRHKDIESFQMEMQGVPGSGAIGVHGGGKCQKSMCFAHTKFRQVTILLAATPVVIFSRLPVIRCSICIMAVSTALGGSGSNWTRRLVRARKVSQERTHSSTTLLRHPLRSTLLSVWGMLLVLKLRWEI